MSFQVVGYKDCDIDIDGKEWLEQRMNRVDHHDVFTHSLFYQILRLQPCYRRILTSL